MWRTGLSVGLAFVLATIASQSANPVAMTTANIQPGNCSQRHFSEFSDWSAPVNLGSVVNTPGSELWPAIAPNDLSLYLATNRPGGSGLLDIWVSRRAGPDAPWGTPLPLGPNVNSTARDNAPYISPDGHRLFFGSNRPGGCGNNDLYVSFRAKTGDDFAWGPAANLGCQVNSTGDEVGPNLVVDDDTGTTSLYFNSNRLGVFNIYVSTLQPDGTFGAPTLVQELNSNSQPPLAGDGPVWIRNDGLEMILNWNTVTNVAIDSDLWMSARGSLSAPWSQPQNLGTSLNTSYADGWPSLSCDGTTLYFGSNRPGGIGGSDLWIATRIPLGTQHP